MTFHGVSVSTYLVYENGIEHKGQTAFERSDRQSTAHSEDTCKQIQLDRTYPADRTAFHAAVGSRVETQICVQTTPLT